MLLRKRDAGISGCCTNFVRQQNVFNSSNNISGFLGVTYGQMQYTPLDESPEGPSVSLVPEFVLEPSPTTRTSSLGFEPATLRFSGQSPNKMSYHHPTYLLLFFIFFAFGYPLVPKPPVLGHKLGPAAFQVAFIFKLL